MQKDLRVKKKMLALLYCRIMNLLHTSLNAVIYDLDALTGSRVNELLFELNAEQGTTLVLVTHDEKLAGRCRRRIRLDGGRVVADEA